MAKQAFNSAKVWETASSLYDKRQFDKCAEKLEEIIAHVDNPELSANIANVKAGVYIDAQNIKSANEEVDRALLFAPNHFQANYTKARLLYYAENNLQQALEHINLAITNYTPDDLDDSSDTAMWVQTFITTRSEIYNLKTSIENDIRSNNLYDQMRQVESNVDEKLRDERMRNIEIIGIFAAILALILATVQGSMHLRGPDFVWLGLGLIIPITFLIFLISPKTDVKGKALITFIVFIAACITVGIFIDRWFLP